MRRGEQTVNAAAKNWRGERWRLGMRGKIWKFRYLLPAPGRARLGVRGGGFEALLPKHLKSKGKTSPLRGKEDLGSHRPELLPRMNPGYSVPITLLMVTAQCEGDTAVRGDGRSGRAECLEVPATRRLRAGWG